MNCFIHNSAPAIGICKHCQKGLCSQCATDTGAGLACIGSCVDVVNSINSLVDRNMQISSKQKSGGYLGSAFLGGLGAVFLLFGLGDVENASLPISMGIGFLIFAVVLAARTFAWPKFEKMATPTTDPNSTETSPVNPKNR